jgi:hypothetical protein
MLDRVLAALLGLAMMVFFAFKARQARSWTIAILGATSVLILEVGGAAGIYRRFEAHA